MTDADVAGCRNGVHLGGAGNLVLSPGNEDDGSQRDSVHVDFYIYGSPIVFLNAHVCSYNVIHLINHSPKDLVEL